VGRGKHKKEQEIIATTMHQATIAREGGATEKKNIDSSTSAKPSRPQRLTFKRDGHTSRRGVTVDVERMSSRKYIARTSTIARGARAASRDSEVSRRLC
jgi:hypothetical protein